jgi:3'-phosphoadenosine 5'-phosphosulfate (PAPS) 3'-phosphatase
MAVADRAAMEMIARSLNSALPAIEVVRPSSAAATHDAGVRRDFLTLQKVRTSEK